MQTIREQIERALKRLYDASGDDLTVLWKVRDELHAEFGPDAMAVTDFDLQWLMEYTGIARVAGLMDEVESARFDGIYAKVANKGE